STRPRRCCSTPRSPPTRSPVDAIIRRPPPLPWTRTLLRARLGSGRLGVRGHRPGQWHVRDRPRDALGGPRLRLATGHLVVCRRTWICYPRPVPSGFSGRGVEGTTEERAPMNRDLTEPILMGTGVQEFLDHHHLEADFRTICELVNDC